LLAIPHGRDLATEMLRMETRGTHKKTSQEMLKSKAITVTIYLDNKPSFWDLAREIW